MSQRFSSDVRAVVLTISDRCSRGEQVDLSGPAVCELLEDAGVGQVISEMLPDELDLIAAALWRNAKVVDLIVTTGGTGLATRDVTPEATRMVCERLVDGLAERMRADGLLHTPLAALSRGVCGTLGDGFDCESAGKPGGGEEFAGGDFAGAAACAGSAGRADGASRSSRSSDQHGRRRRQLE